MFPLKIVIVHSYVSLPEGNDMLKLFEFLIPELNHQNHTCLKLHGIIRGILTMRLMIIPKKCNWPVQTQTHPIFAGISSHFCCWKYMGNAWKIYLSLLQMISKRSLRYIPLTFPWNKIQSSKLSPIVYQCVYIYIMHWFDSFIFIHSLLNEILPWYPLLN